ncbi:MAG: hypothetical protein IPM29_09530 [Planctomycetes bacterium]|nr:hypothetical protein [Planctomycetota bacterium]
MTTEATSSELTRRGGTTDSRAGTPAAIRAAFADTFVPVALRGLPRMLRERGDVFCFKAYAGEGPAELALEGTSERYGAMSLLGLAAQARLDPRAQLPAFDAVVDRLDAWARGPADPGDAGLVIWLHLLRGDDRAESLAQRTLERRDEVFVPTYGESMELGCLVAGLAEAVRAGIGGPALRGFLDDVAERLAANQHEQTGLFSFGRKVFRKNLHRARVDARLGSFASQVYPTIGLSLLARATGDERALQRARACAQRIAALQGPAGQWWWIYHKGRAVPVVRFPVYSVHQDAMGPMMLCAAALADGATDRYDDAIARSLEWFDDRPELPGAGMIDAERGVVWRAVQHDDPASTGRLGLGGGELARLGRAAWFGTADERPLAGGFVCQECRPYHLGWILLADALYRELCAARG